MADSTMKATFHDVSAVPSTGHSSMTLCLLTLPEEVFEIILRNLSFNEVAKSRVVCKRFDQICQRILNKTFFKLQNRMLQRFQLIKNQMPRRESLRRKHPLARECDIVETLHMRLTLLQMTFGKHIERKHCCFFAGEVLDEIYRILGYIRKTDSPGRAYKVTDELFDLSTMALEYFKEHIEGTLPEINYFSNYPDIPTIQDITPTLSTPASKTISFSLASCETPKPSTSKTSPQQSTTSHFSTKVIHLRNRIRSSNIVINHLRKELKTFKSKMEDQQRQIAEYNSKLEQHDRQFVEQDRKFNALMLEFQTCKTEVVEMKESSSPKTHEETNMSMNPRKRSYHLPETCTQEQPTTSTRRKKQKIKKDKRI